MQNALTVKIHEKSSTMDRLLEMKKLRIIQIRKVWKLTEVSKRQRIILERLGISIPIGPNPVLINSEYRNGMTKSGPSPMLG